MSPRPQRNRIETKFNLDAASQRFIQHTPPNPISGRFTSTFGTHEEAGRKGNNMLACRQFMQRQNFEQAPLSELFELMIGLLVDLLETT